MIKNNLKKIRQIFLSLSVVYPIVVGVLASEPLRQAELLYYPAVFLSMLSLGVYIYRNYEFLKENRTPPTGLIGYAVLAFIVSVALVLPLLQIDNLFFSILPSYIFTVVFLIVASLTEG